MEDTPVPAAEVLIDLKGMPILIQVPSFMTTFYLNTFAQYRQHCFYVQYMYMYGVTLLDPLRLAELLLEVVWLCSGMHIHLHTNIILLVYMYMYVVQQIQAPLQ